MSVAAFWRDLESDGYEMLNLRHINQDCLEGWFSKVRNGCGANDNPTVMEFERTFGNCLVKERNENRMKGANCESGGGYILVTLEHLMDITDNLETAHEEKSTNNTSTDDEDVCPPSPPCLHIPEYTYVMII